MRTTTGWRPRSEPIAAGLPSRSVAFAIDTAIVAALRAALHQLLQPVAAASTDAFSDVGTILLLQSIPLAYFIALETCRGATTGKQVLGLVILGQHDRPVPLTDVVKRRWWLVFTAPISTPVGFGFVLLAGWAWWTAFLDPHRRGFHHKHANTRVVTAN